MSEAPSVPATAEELRAAILERYDGLAKRLQQIARYVLDEPNELALETLAVIAERSGVQPSAIVRFTAAYNITTPAVYDLAACTFGLALLHFVGEWLGFGSAQLKGRFVSPLIVASASLTWMLTQRDAYLGL